MNINRSPSAQRDDGDAPDQRLQGEVSTGWFSSPPWLKGTMIDSESAAGLISLDKQ
jgi:hypothetical protein